MRLTNDEVAAIRECAHRYFGAAAEVRLFGSRVDDAHRGGDIDLHIVAERADLVACDAEYAFRSDLQRRIGERRIDLVLRGPGEPPEPIDRIAVATGVRL